MMETILLTMITGMQAILLPVIISMQGRLSKVEQKLNDLIYFAYNGKKKR